MAAPRTLFPHYPGSPHPGYVVLAKTGNHNRVSDTVNHNASSPSLPSQEFLIYTNTLLQLPCFTTRIKSKSYSAVGTGQSWQYNAGGHWVMSFSRIAHWICACAMQVSLACSGECMSRFDGEDRVSNGEGENRELLMAAVPERSKLGFRNPWEWYQNCLLKRPLCTQMVTSGMLWSIGDLIAQILSLATSSQAPVGTVTPESPIGGSGSSLVYDDLRSNDGRLNWRRVAASGSFGGAFVGPTGHYWYQFLEYVCTSKLKLEPHSGQFVVAKLCADTLLFGPLHLLVFFFYMSLTAGKTFLQFKQALRRDYFPTLLSEGVLWTCVQVINFRYVPVKHQLLFVNCVCAVDSAFLSWIKHSDNVPWKNWTTNNK